MARNQTETCPRDGFPMITIDGRQICSVEHADALIGGQRVVDAREQDGLLFLVFGNGSSLPLTCPCCGGRLHLRSMTLDELSKMLSDRVLEGFRHGEWVSHANGGDRHAIFALQFAGEEDLHARTIQVHLESVRRIASQATIPITMSLLH